MKHCWGWDRVHYPFPCVEIPAVHCERTLYRCFALSRGLLLFPAGSGSFCCPRVRSVGSEYSRWILAFQLYRDVPHGNSPCSCPWSRATALCFVPSVKVSKVMHFTISLALLTEFSRGTARLCEGAFHGNNKFQFCPLQHRLHLSPAPLSSIAQTRR